MHVYSFFVVGDGYNKLICTCAAIQKHPNAAEMLRVMLCFPGNTGSAAVGELGQTSFGQSIARNVFPPLCLFNGRFSIELSLLGVWNSTPWEDKIITWWIVLIFSAACRQGRRIKLNLGYMKRFQRQSWHLNECLLIHMWRHLGFTAFLPEQKKSKLPEGEIWAVGEGGVLTPADNSWGKVDNQVRTPLDPQWGKLGQNQDERQLNPHQTDHPISTFSLLLPLSNHRAPFYRSSFTFPRSFHPSFLNYSSSLFSLSAELPSFPVPAWSRAHRLWGMSNSITGGRIWWTRGRPGLSRRRFTESFSEFLLSSTQIAHMPVLSWNSTFFN